MADEPKNPLPATSGEVEKLITSVAALRDAVDGLALRVGAVEKALTPKAAPVERAATNQTTGSWLF